MSKDDVVAAQKQAVLDGQDAALVSGLGACYDAGVLSAGSGGGFSQADIDAAVAAQKAVDDASAAEQKVADDAALAASQAADAQALADAQAQGAAALAALQAQLDAVSAAKSVEDGVIQGLQDSLDKIQSVLDILKSLGLPVPPVS